jgi:WD40 repeat protein
VEACAFSPDGRRFVSASDDKTLIVWDAEGDADIRDQESHGDRVTGCAFSPDGRRVASVSWDKEMRVLDAESGSKILILRTQISSLMDCAFSPDGRRVVASGSGSLKVWDAQSGSEALAVETNAGYVEGCAFSPDGGRIASAGSDGTVKVWDAENGARILSLEGHNGWLHDCAFSPDGRRIVSASGSEDASDEVRNDNTLKTWDVRSGAEMLSLEGHANPVNACVFSPDGRRVVSASYTELIVWDAERGRKVRTLRGHTGDVTACVFTPDGRWIVSASEDKTLKLWRAGSGNAVATLPLLYELLSLDVHPWLPKVVCGDRDGAIYQAELEGIQYGPPIVTAAEKDGSAFVRCPACFEESPIEHGWLGQVITCPARGDLRLRVNPFAVGAI